MDDTTSQDINMEGASHQEKQNDKGSNEKPDRCYSWMTHHRLGWLARLPGRWPRSFSLIVGVIAPLFLLIGVSLFFGYGLAKLEAPSEIDSNNGILANRARIAAWDQFHRNVTEHLPGICFDIFTNDLPINETLEMELDKIVADVLDGQAQTTLNSSGIELDTSRLSELVEFMAECGKVALQAVDKSALQDIDHGYTAGDLTFNWIRCDSVASNSTATLYYQIWGLPYVDRDRLKPDAQAANAISEWRRSQLELYNQYMEDLVLPNGTRPLGAPVLAYRQSLEYANGFDQCYPNSAAGAWFWFTVMTTIGYGNTAPVTEGGRAMIYTLGFFSILLFAVILGTAGTIVVAIWDDFINRTKLHHFNIPWVACIFWGFCYYAWMLVIASVTRRWKSARLDEEMDFSEAYWFSYISTTTVGFGDYYLEHDVILRQDLFVFPVLFLAGFVLLANFFVKLTGVLTSLIPHNRPTLEETLAESDVPCMPKLATKPFDAITNLTYTKRRHEVGSEEESKSSESNENDAELSTQALQIGNEAAVANEDDSAAHDQTEPVPMEVNGWKGTVTGLATHSPAESAP